MSAMNSLEQDSKEEFGLRVNWQSEAVKIEAAEFMVATRVQHDARIRAAHDLELLRHPDLLPDAEPGSAVGGEDDQDSVTAAT